MKHIYVILSLLFLSGQLFSQGSAAPITSSLNLSKSNANRIVYPSALLTQENADLLLAELDKQPSMDEAGLKAWMTSNYKKFGINASSVQYLAVFSGKSTDDCIGCDKTCPGRCIKTPNACVCLTKPDASYKTVSADKTQNYIFISSEPVDDLRAMGRIATTVKEKTPAATTTTAKKPKAATTTTPGTGAGMKKQQKQD